MRMIFSKRYILVGVLVVAVCVVGLFSWRAYEASAASVDWTGKEEVTIVLGRDGFEPEETYVTEGTRVIFKTARGVSFWPASDLHPFHSTYPDFDPRRPIEKGETWSLVFDKDGRWSYHDHIDPGAVGILIVLPPGTPGHGAYEIPISCDMESAIHRKACWKERIMGVFDADGLDAAFDEMEKIYAEDPRFASRCHDYGHDLGLLAYRRYRDEVPKTAKTATCGQGFYHGYMEAFLFGTDGDVAQAVRFCEGEAEHHGDAFTLGARQCLHGIGHGQMEYLLSSNLDLMNDLPRLIGLGISDCAKLPDYDGRYRCSSGVYAVTKDWINIQKLTAAYPQFFSLEHPYALCAFVSDDWAKRGCAWELSKQALIMAKMDPIAAFAAQIPAGRSWAPEHLLHMVRSTAFLIGELGVTKDDVELVRACRSIHEPDLRESCVKGIVDGLMFNGDPKDEVERSARFCASEGLSANERSGCFESILRYILQARGPEGLKDACEALKVYPPEMPTCNATQGTL